MILLKKEQNMDGQLNSSAALIGTSIGAVGGAQPDQAPSVVMSEVQKVEELVYNLYYKLDSVIAPVPNDTTAQNSSSGNLLSSRLRLISSTLEHILTNIEL
jgi:hypothetical protein